MPVGLVRFIANSVRKLFGRFRRWGTNPGSVRIDHERVPIRVPRVRDIDDARERPLESYQHLKDGTLDR